MFGLPWNSISLKNGNTQMLVETFSGFIEGVTDDGKLNFTINSGTLELNDNKAIILAD